MNKNTNSPYPYIIYQSYKVKCFVFSILRLTRNKLQYSIVPYRVIIQEMIEMILIYTFNRGFSVTFRLTSFSKARDLYPAKST